MSGHAAGLATVSGPVRKVASAGTGALGAPTTATVKKLSSPAVDATARATASES